MDARIEGVTAAGGNAWIVGDDDEVIVIDPGPDAGRVLDAVGEREILAVICTHGHAAHVAAAVEVAERDESPVALHPADRVSWRVVHPDETRTSRWRTAADSRSPTSGWRCCTRPATAPARSACTARSSTPCSPATSLSADGPVPHDGDFPDFPRQLSSIGEQMLTLPARPGCCPATAPELTVAAAEKNFDSWVAAGATGLLAGRRHRVATGRDHRAGGGLAAGEGQHGGRWSSSASRACRAGCTRARRPG